jgi:hypothetical protein
LYREYLGSASFFVGLRRLDEEIAAEARSRGCPHCGGPLYAANYPRRPRGLEFAVEGELAVRLSLCCGREGCRRRVTPASVRFFGRRVYAAVAFLLVSTLLTERISEEVAGRIEFHIGVSLETLKRWRWWWRERFVRSRFWSWARGMFSPPLSEQGVVASEIVERFGGVEDGGGVSRCLRFLSPLSTASCPTTVRVAGAGGPSRRR